MQKNHVRLIIGQRRLAAAVRMLIFAVAAMARQTYGITLTDSEYFTGQPHTLVTFEQRGDGTPTPTANATPLPAAEYSAQGFTFAPGLSPGVAWINDLSTDADAAQAVGGSLPLGIGATDNQGDFIIHFSSRPVKAFGFWVLHSNQRPGTPRFDAIGTRGILESAFFNGSAIDGAVGNIAYGFLGIAAAEPIHSIHVRGDVALLDNFRFIAVPEPPGYFSLGAGCLALCHLGMRRAHRNATMATQLLVATKTRLD
jgi:hypothetical protein